MKVSHDKFEDNKTVYWHFVDLVITMSGLTKFVFDKEMQYCIKATNDYNFFGNFN